MAKFHIECPHCKTLNQASTFILAKKLIKCGSCGKDIDVKANRLGSKTCPHCKNVFVYDQAKDNNVCPACHKKIEPGTGKMVSFGCPQCGCTMTVDENSATATCPVCDYFVSDVNKQAAKSRLVSDGGISVLKYEGDNSTFIWKHPIEDFNTGSQLIVHESQEAVFFLDGQALDSFGPGRYSLETENMPLLKKFLKLPTNGQNPFHAEIYFINKTVQMGLKWGTDSRVRFIEPNTGIPLDLGASGEMNLQVSDGRKLLIKLVGTAGGLTRQQILNAAAAQDRKLLGGNTDGDWAAALKGFFRPLIMTTIKTHLASAIKEQNLNILEIDAQLEALSTALGSKITLGFEEYGLTIPQFYVTNVALPEDDANFKKIKELLASQYLGVREAEVEADIVAAKRKKILEQQQTELEIARFEAEKKRVAGEMDIELQRQRGLTEAEIMAAKGYSEKDVLQADVQKAYAAGIGQMGANGGGGSGIVSDMLGLGVGLAAAGQVGGQVGDMMKGFAGGNASAETPKADGWKCSCGAEGNTGKFCAECGSPKPELWDCACGAKGNKGKFCSECGAPKPEAWDCPHCGAKGNKGKFCSECGKTREVADTWDCKCGKKGITGKFCSECGAKKEDNE